MRKAVTTSKTIVHFTMFRRPETSKHGDERGRVWKHKYSYLDKMFCRSARVSRKLAFSFNTI